MKVGGWGANSASMDRLAELLESPCRAIPSRLVGGGLVGSPSCFRPTRELPAAKAVRRALVVTLRRACRPPRSIGQLLAGVRHAHRPPSSPKSLTGPASSES